MIRKGLLLTIEGIQGAGKTRLTDTLEARLRAAGVTNIIRAADGGFSAIGQYIRGFLDKAGEGSVPLQRNSAVFLAAAAFSEDVSQVVRPGLLNGFVLIGDTFHDSQLAAEAASGGVSFSLVESLLPRSVSECVPDLTLLLGGEAEALYPRSSGAIPSSDPQTGKALDFQRKTRDAFLFLCSREPSRFRLLDASQPPEVIDGAAWEAVKAALRLRGIIFREDPPEDPEFTPQEDRSAPEAPSGDKVTAPTKAARRKGNTAK